MFGEIYPGDATALDHPERDIAYRWVRDGDFKLIVPHKQQGTIWREYVTAPALFDVVNDPHERRDLVQLPGQTATVRRLRRLLDQWWNPQRE